MILNAIKTHCIEMLSLILKCLPFKHAHLNCLRDGTKSKQQV